MTIILSIRGLGANWLGCYGNEWIATLNLDLLAAEGVVYDRCYAESLAPVPFDAEMRMLSLLPPWNAPAEIFEDYYEGDPVTPITVPKSGDNWDRLHASFASAVTMLDAEIGAMMERQPDATWIIAGSHGFPLGEHGIVGLDDCPPYEELVHVPLVVRHADRRRAGTHVSQFTTPGDLAAILKGEPLPSRNRVISVIGPHRAIRTADWTLLQTGAACKLFHRPEDRFEMNDVSRLHPEIVEVLQGIG